ncbi:hypothetical protein MC885_005377, partial [Smutsia gigantea]
VHTCIISYLKKEMPSVFGKENKKKQVIFKLPVMFAKFSWSITYLPKMQELLTALDFTKFHSLKPKLLEALDEMLTHDITKLMPQLRQEELERTEADDEAEWVVTKDKSKYDEIFYNLVPANGKLSGTKVKTWMVGTKLPNSVLGCIWKLSNVDRMACWTTRSLPWPATSSRPSSRATGCPPTCPAASCHPPSGVTRAPLSEPAIARWPSLPLPCCGSPARLTACTLALWPSCTPSAHSLSCMDGGQDPPPHHILRSQDHSGS